MKTAVQQMIDDLEEAGYNVKELAIMKRYLEMEQDQMKRAALRFIVLGGQKYGCNWNEMNFTDEWNKLMNNKRSV